MTELARLMILRNRQSASGGGAGRAVGVRLHRPVAAACGCGRWPTQIAAADRQARLLAPPSSAPRRCARRPNGSPTSSATTTSCSTSPRPTRLALEAAWSARQVDRLFRVGRGDRRRRRRCPTPMAAEPLQAQQLVDLILLHPAGHGRAAAAARPGSTALRPARLFHLRDGHGADVDRMARVLTGQSVGLVLSGGGARAYAHVGAVRALRERGRADRLRRRRLHGRDHRRGRRHGLGRRRDGAPHPPGLRRHQPAGRHRLPDDRHDPRRQGPRAAGASTSATARSPTCGCRSSASRPT